MPGNKRISGDNYILGKQPGSFTKEVRKKMNTIGVIVHHLEGYFTMSVLKGIRETVAGSGYELVITHSEQNVEKEVANAQLLLENAVAGLIVLPTAGTVSPDHFESFTKQGIPVVFFASVKDDGCNNTVVIDEASCSYEATEHLIKQGCRKIAMVMCGPYRNVNSQRYRGYIAALEKYGIPFGRDLLLARADDKAVGVWAAGQIMQMDTKADGVFFTDDLEAAACMHILKEAGIRIPDDIAIVGFNNDPISRLVSPALTTINYPGYEVGTATARKLLSQLNEPGQVQSSATVIPAPLIVRASSLKTPSSVA